MYRRGSLVVAVCLLVACGAHTAPPPPRDPAPAPAPAGPPPATLDALDLVTADATAIARQAAGYVALVSAVERMLPSVPPCWNQLVGRVRAAYQVEVGPGGAYHIFESDLPRDEVEACAYELRAFEPFVRRDGPIDEFIERGGRFYAAWRGPLVIVARRRALVEAALAVRSPTVARTWRDRLAALSPGPLVVWRTDPLLANLIGVPTVAYQVVIETVAADPPRFAGVVVAQFAHPEAAALAAERIRTGAWQSPLDPPPEMIAAMTRLVVTTRGPELEARFDERTFVGVDLAMLRSWTMPGAAPANP